MSESKYEFMGARPDVRHFERNALSLWEKRIENGDVLFEAQGEASDATVHYRTDGYRKRKRKRERRRSRIGVRDVLCINK